MLRIAGDYERIAQHLEQRAKTAGLVDTYHTLIALCVMSPLYPPDAVQGSRDRLGAVLSPVPRFEGSEARGDH